MQICDFGCLIWGFTAKIWGKIPIKVKNEPQIGSSLWRKSSRSPTKIEKRLELSRLESMTRPATSGDPLAEYPEYLSYLCAFQAETKFVGPAIPMRYLHQFD
jgi:hypothetical protein